MVQRKNGEYAACPNYGADVTAATAANCGVTMSVGSTEDLIDLSASGLASSRRETNVEPGGRLDQRRIYHHHVSRARNQRMNNIQDTGAVGMQGALHGQVTNMVR
jgi:hypothetical protein